MSIKISDRVAQLETQVSNQVVALNNIMDSLEKVIVAVNSIKQNAKVAEAPVASSITPVIYRYVRGYDPHNEFSASPDNLRCITLAAQIDYNANTISYGWAIADGENVNKAVGRDISFARLQRDPIVVGYARSHLAHSDLTGILAAHLGIKFTSDRDVLFALMSQKLKHRQ